MQKQKNVVQSTPIKCGSFDAEERARLSLHAGRLAAELIHEARLYGEHVAYVLDLMAQDRYQCR